jgi:hypothetical protein
MAAAILSANRFSPLASEFPLIATPDDDSVPPV